MLDRILYLLAVLGHSVNAEALLTASAQIVQEQLKTK